ncbi:MAG: nucleoside triphosphate pyrophosphohydrolase [Gammaproteobacteria bacterium]|nr:nucleoside triphosphate pyrophosphohydrolase [Gammaproteobacteria bacterium]
MSGRGMEELLEIMRRLRADAGGCPWDRAQTFESLRPHTLEEAYEVADAIERGDVAGLRDELGDLLFQVVFHARIAEEAGQFDFEAVAAGIVAKLIRRHPHVFEAARNGDATAGAWEAHKARERADRGDHGALAGVARALPALTRAVKLQNRAARDGFDWPEVGRVFDKIAEEIAEVRAELHTPPGSPELIHEVGDLLLAVSNLARHLGVDPEAALGQANRRFERRYARMEAIAAGVGERFGELDLDRQEALWRQAKAEEP